MSHLREKLRYRFENFMSKGGASIILSLSVLFFVSLGITFAVRAVLLVLAPEFKIFETMGDHFWIVFLEMTDPGSMAVDKESSWVMKGAAALTGMTGVVIFSMLIAFITTSLDSLLWQFRKGRSQVIETDQTLILGWNDRVLDIIRELVIANESEKDGAIVILADRDKEEMDDRIRTSIRNTRSTRVITRRGSPPTLANLKRINASEARSAIILATCPDQSSDADKQASDATVIKTILALIGAQGGDNEINIVAELYLEESRGLVDTFGDQKITCVDSWDILGKILVQTSRTSGLAVVYNEILSFEGCEFYYYKADWNRIPFYRAIFHFPDGILLGIRRASGGLQLRPTSDAVLEEGDEVLVVAEDDSTIDFQPQPVVQPRELPFTMKRQESKIERELVLGWHPIAKVVIREYADYLMDGSSITIVVRDPNAEVRAAVGRLQRENERLNIELRDGNPLCLTELRALRPFTYDNVLVLSQSGVENPGKTDSETLMILLLLRGIQRDDHHNDTNAKLITQILDSENQELVQQTAVDDFIISNRLITMIFAQLSEDPRIKGLYDSIFAASDSEIYLKPVELYFPELPVELSFADLMALALRRDEICLGYRHIDKAKDADHNFGVRLNPPKYAVVTLTAGDTIVVMADDEL